MIKLLIIIPAYNAENHIINALKSIEPLRNLGVEAIVIDDGSTDRTNKLVFDYIQAGIGISTTLISGKNGGVAFARNRGILVSESEWIMFLDADDTLDFVGIQRILAYVNTNTDIYFGYFTYKYINGSERKSKSAIPIGPVQRDFFLEKYFERKEVVHISSCLFNGDLIKRSGVRFLEGYSYAEDQHFLLSVIMVAGAIEKCNERTFYYWQHKNSATKITTNKQLDAINIFIDSKFVEKVPILLRNIYRSYYLPLIALGAMGKVRSISKLKDKYFREYSLLMTILKKFNPIISWTPKNLFYYFISIFPTSFKVYEYFLQTVSRVMKIIH